MKQCNKCNSEKALSYFEKDPRNKDGLQGICQACRKEAKKASRDRRLAGIGVLEVEEKECNKCGETKKSKEFFKDCGISDGKSTICKKCKTDDVSKWREKNREKYNSDMRLYTAKNYQRLRMQRYKITPEIHANMMSEQKGVCAVCCNIQRGRRPLVIDHNHATGKVRGLLCYGCNRALHVLETSDLLSKAQAYLLKHS